MRANVIHTDLNACGGAEQLALSTIHAFIEMDMDVELTTAKMPDISKLKNAFGGERVDRLFNQIKKINLLRELPGINFEPTMRLSDTNDANYKARNYDIVVNTHGDVLPYFLPTFSRNTTITYCHFPVAIDSINSRDLAYLRYLAGLGLVDKDIVYGDAKTRNELWQKLRQH